MRQHKHEVGNGSDIDAMPGQKTYTTTYAVHQNDVTDLSPYPASVYGPDGEVAAVRNQGSDTARIARELAAAPDMLATLQIIYANAAESPEWIRARIAPVIAKATKGACNGK